MVNKLTLIGRVGNAPEIKTLDNGSKVAKFSLATTEKYKDKNGDKIENTEWHNLVFWRNLVDVVEMFVEKGMLLHIEGKIRYRSYEKNGVKQYFTEIEGRELNMLSSKEKKEEKPKEQEKEPPEEADDLPF